MTELSLLHEPIAALPFGSSPAHLDLDLGSPDRPRLVSMLLQASLRTDDGDPVDRAGLDATDIVRRQQWLIALCRSTGIEDIELRMACPACGAEMSLPLELAAFAEIAPPEGFCCEPEPGIRVHLRLPTAADLVRWADEGIEDARRLAADLVTAIEGDAGDGVDTAGPARADVPPRWMPLIEETLARADPFTALSLDTRCPDCGGALEVPLDLEQLLLQRLAAEQRRVLGEIHLLASAYHWSEREILALPPARRAFYLRCISGGQ